MRAQLAGVLVASASALLYDVGYILEKQGLEGLPRVGLHPKSVVQTVLRSKRWLAGFVAMLGGLGLQLIALTMAPVSVVQPILAGGLIALVAAGSVFLGERLNRRETVALALVLVAVAATAISAHGATPLARSVPVGKFVMLAIPLGVIGGLVGRIGTVNPGSPRSLAAAGVGAGLLYGLGAVAEKAVATRLVGHGIVAGIGSAIASGYPWVFIVATAAGMIVFQVGLQPHPASLMVSLTNIVSTVCVLTAASVVFSEALVPSGWWMLARLIGFAGVLGALAVLTLDRARTEEDASSLEASVARSPVTSGVG